MSVRKHFYIKNVSSKFLIFHEKYVTSPSAERLRAKSNFLAPTSSLPFTVCSSFPPISKRHMYSDVHSITVPVCCHVSSYSVPDGAPRTETDRTTALGQQGLPTRQRLVL